tara:strand:- start:157 stop:1017 length:861 start_codon:yes stop_codon:yes gene_type:complete
MPYLGRSSQKAIRQRFIFTIPITGATAVSGADDSNATLRFDDGEYVDVILNGITLAKTEYNTTTANTIGGLAEMSSGDVLQVTVYDMFNVADAVSASTGGTFNGGITINGDLTVTGSGAGAAGVVSASTSGTAINIDSSNRVTMSSQPSFYAYPDANIAVSNSTSLSTFAANTELYDNGSNYNTSTYKFTAPVTGKYLIKWGFRLDSSDSGATYYYYRIYTSNRAYDQIYKPTADETYSAPHNIAIVDLDANDEAYLQYQQYSGTNNHATIVSNSGLTYIQGILLS